MQKVRGARPNAISRNVDQPEDYLPPPDGVAKEFAERWNTIVHDYPGGWFRVSDIYLLTEFVRISLQLDDLNEIVSNLAAPFYETSKGDIREHPAIALQARLRNALRGYSSSTKLSVSSRADCSQVPKANKKKKVSENSILEGLV